MLKALCTRKVVFTSKKGTELCKCDLVYENGETNVVIVKPEVAKDVEVSDITILKELTWYEVVYDRRGYCIEFR